MSKFYRVKKDTFMWLEGAVLKQNSDGYVAISDLWDACDVGAEYISSRIIESPDNAEWFERVHEVSVLGKAKYLTTEAAREVHNKLYQGDE